MSGNILTLLSWCSKLLTIFYDRCKDSNAKILQQKSMATVLHNSSLLKLFMCFIYTFFLHLSQNQQILLNESYNLNINSVSLSHIDESNNYYFKTWGESFSKEICGTVRLPV